MLTLVPLPRPFARIHDVACLADYAARPATAWEHAAEIRRIYGYRDFTDSAESFRLVRWLYARASLGRSDRVISEFAVIQRESRERAVVCRGLTGSSHASHSVTARTGWPHARCSITTGPPPASAT